MNHATTRSMMRWTHTAEQPSSIPVIRTSRPDCSSYAVVVPAPELRLVRRSPPTSILMPTSRLLGLSRHGVLPNNSRRRDLPRAPPARQLMAGADITRLTRRRSRRTRTTSSEARHTEGKVPLHTPVRCNGSPAPGRSSRCARSSKLLRLRRRLRSPSKASRPTGTPEARILERPGPYSAGGLLGPTLLCKALRRRPLRQLPNRCLGRGASATPAITPSMMHDPDRTTAQSHLLSILRGAVLNLKCVPSTITACRHPNRLTHSISRDHRRRLPTQTPRKVPPRLQWTRRRRTRRRRPPHSLVMVCTESRSGRHLSVPSECGTGRMNLLPRSRPTRRTGLAWRTCDTVGPRRRPAKATAAAHLKLGGLRSNAGWMSRGTATKDIILPKRPTIRPRRHTSRRSSRDQRQCKGSSMMVRDNRPRDPLLQRKNTRTRRAVRPLRRRP